MRGVLLLGLLGLSFVCDSEARSKPKDPLQCIDENGTPVDWFVIMKFPRISKSSDPLIKKGEGFISMSSLDDKWKMSEIGITDKSTAAGRTMEPVYEENDFLYTMYNDQPPEGDESGTLGHTKGAVAFDGTSGFWLVHSVPRYVSEPKDGYSYPATATRYGQTMLCLTLHDTHVADQLGELLRYAHINVYDSNKGRADIAKTVSNLAARTGRPRGKIPNNPAYYILNITYSDTDVAAFGKSRHFNADLYHQLLAPTLKTHLFANTWQSARDPLPSNCTEWSVDNVDDLKIPGTTDTYSSNLDHSKWAISQQKSKPWVCIGGINRTKFQMQRGGESVCLRNEGLWRAFNGLIAKTEGCPVDGA